MPRTPGTTMKESEGRGASFNGRIPGGTGLY